MKEMRKKSNRINNNHEILSNLKKELLELQIKVMTEEAEEKKKINMLTIKNLEADIKIKQCKLREIQNNGFLF